jgi:hypothetical protein
MSFRCGSCATAVAPKIKPIIHSLYREVVHEVQVEGEVLAFPGTEIVEEVMLCPDCGHVEHKERPCDFSSFVVLAQSHHNHTRRCDGTTSFKKFNRETKKMEKVSEPCGVCARIMGSFATFPPQALTLALEQKMAPPRKFSIASLTLDAMIRRTHHQSVRADRDFQAAYRILKGFESRGGGL